MRNQQTWGNRQKKHRDTQGTTRRQTSKEQKEAHTKYTHKVKSRQQEGNTAEPIRHEEAKQNTLTKDKDYQNKT